MNLRNPANPALIFVLLTIGFLSRLVPHVWNFTPVLALALLSGTALNGWWRFVVPLVFMVVTDVILGFYPSIVINWVALAACVGIGIWLGRKPSWTRIGAGSLAAAVVFFVISNFGVWLESYPKTVAGFVDCYVLALPFFRNSLLSTMVYGYVLIGGYAWMARTVPSKQTIR